MLDRVYNPRSDVPVRYSTTMPDPTSRFFDRFFGNLGRDSEELSNRRWMPATDIRETEDHYEVTAELPGMTKDDVAITLENNQLTLSGERRFERDNDEQSFHRVERAYGAFARSFALPKNVDAEKVDARFADGVLTVTVPKLEEARPRKIAIH